MIVKLLLASMGLEFDAGHWLVNCVKSGWWLPSAGVCRSLLEQSLQQAVQPTILGNHNQVCAQ